MRSSLPAFFIMEKKYALIAVCILILALVGIYIFSEISGKVTGIFNKKSGSGGTVVQLTMDNFHLFLQQQQVVKDLPSDSVISLKLYSFDSGERVWEKSYILNKGSVKEGNAENPEISIIIASKYIYDAARDLCSAVNKAKANGDFRADNNMATGSFLWKYKGMIKYRSCFGF